MKTMIQKIGSILENSIIFFFENIFHIPIDGEKAKSILQFIKFGCVGASNTVLHYIVYLLLALMGLQYMIANFVAFTISVINSFYWNNRYVFKDDGRVKRSWIFTFIKTYVSYGVTGIVLNSIMLHIEIDIWGISKLIAPIMNLLITIPLNFVINKFWAYKEKV